MRWAVGVVAVATLAIGVASSLPGSAASLEVDGGVIHVWRFEVTPPTSDITDSCRAILAKPGAILTVGDDGPNTFHGGNHPQVILGLGGNDILHGGTQEDCLVGGPGNDHLYGDKAQDVLLGGEGNDFIDGGNAPDEIDGGAGETDVCVGGNGQDTIRNCEDAAD